MSATAARTAALALALAGCGYHLVAARPPAGMGRIAVVPPREAGTAGIGPELAAGLGLRLAAQGVRLATDVAAADGVLGGEVRVRTLPAVARAGILTYQLSGHLELALVGRDGATAWAGAVDATEDYLPAPPGREPAETEASRRAALHRLAERLADAVQERLVAAGA